MSPDLDRVMFDIGLSKAEQAVFSILASRIGAVVSKKELLSGLRARAPHTIDSHIMAIRRKLADRVRGVSIETVQRAGFILREAKSHA